MSARHDFIVRQGNSFDLIFRFRDGVGALVDLSGSKLSLSIDAGPKCRKLFDLVAAAPTNGEAAFHLSADEARGLPVGALPYEVERVAGPSQTTILTGLVIVNRGVNNDR